MGDFRGFVHVMDAKYEQIRERIVNSPVALYKGHFKIIDQLIWTDLLARGDQGQEYSVYWQLARRHPLGVYVSTVVKIPAILIPPCDEFVEEFNGSPS